MPGYFPGGPGTRALRQPDPGPTPLGEHFPDSATTRHGTTSGYSKHQEREEEPCELCRMAKAEYDRRWRDADTVTQRNRVGSKAQGRALTELRKRHREEYLSLYRAERDRLFTEQGLDPVAYDRDVKP